MHFLIKVIIRIRKLRREGRRGGGEEKKNQAMVKD